MKVLLILLMFGIHVLAQERVDTLVARVVEQAAAKGLDRWDAIVENGDSVMASPEFKELAQLAPSTWRGSFASFGQKSGEEKKTILALSYQFLPPAEYIEFLDRAADAVKHGTLSRPLLSYCVFANGRMRFLLADNYKDQRVIETVPKLKEALAGDKEVMGAFDSVLSGESKASVDAMREMENHPTVFLPGSPNASEATVSSTAVKGNPGIISGRMAWLLAGIVAVALFFAVFMAKRTKCRRGHL